MGSSIDADVVVIGAGAVGLACARALAGARTVIVLEKAEGSGTVLSSEPGLGGTVTIATTILDGPFTISVSAPTWVEYPSGFDVGAATLRSKHSAIGTLGIDEPYSSNAATHNFSARLLSGAVLTIHHRIVSAGFHEGTYRTRTVVTCS